jgi:hypothetical protein
MVEGHVLRCTPRTVQQQDDLARGGPPDLRAGPSSQKWQNIIASSSPLKRAIASVPSDRDTVRGSPQALPSSTIQKAWTVLVRPARTPWLCGAAVPRRPPEVNSITSAHLLSRGPSNDQS